MRVLMTGGGTGGHVNPAVAIANTIKANIPNAEIAFVGTSRGIENKIVKAEGYPIYHVEIQYIKRSLSLSNLKTAYLVLVSPIRAKKIIHEFKPDIVIGTGGYVCWPMIVAASRLGIPTIIHEANAVPGVTVKMLQKYSDKILLNFQEAAKELTHKDKILHVGNPLRSDFSALDKKKARVKLGYEGKYNKVILSFGGSLGAMRINEAALEIMKDYVCKNPDVLHIHATGSIEFIEATEKFKSMGLDKFDNIKLLEYIYDMPYQMAAADVVICRAGSMTLSELAMQKKACILIPSPNVTNDHQYKNAKAFADIGGAVVFRESELAQGKIVDEVKKLITNDGLRAEMGVNIAKFAEKDANKLIFNEVVNLVKANKN